jgi:hypothetical protein
MRSGLKYDRERRSNVIDDMIVSLVPFLSRGLESLGPLRDYQSKVVAVINLIVFFRDVRSSEPRKSDRTVCYIGLIACIISFS